jgi:hypothetical protein
LSMEEAGIIVVVDVASMAELMAGGRCWIVAADISLKFCYWVARPRPSVVVLVLESMEIKATEKSNNVRNGPGVFTDHNY